MCEYCLTEGKTTPSQEVDHIVPHKGDEALFWMEGNYQALCSPCHKVKTWEEANPQSIPKFVQCKPSWMNVILGPPASGKTTEAKRIQSEQGGIIYDLDDIAEDLNMPRYGRTWEQARLALWHRNFALRNHPHGIGLILIQTDVTAPQRAVMQRRFGATFTQMIASTETIKDRLNSRTQEHAK